MPMSLMAAVEIGYGGYIAIWKLLLFILAFAGWCMMVKWVFLDTQAVRTNVLLWSLITLLCGPITFFLWLIIPAFFIGLLFYAIVVGGVAMVYITHRNARVADFEKVLTADHFRNLFSNQNKKIEKSSHGLTFISANGNEVPLPEPKSKELEGFVVICEIIDDVLWSRSDITQLIPQKDEYTVVYEIDGMLRKQDPRSLEEIEFCAYYAKQLAGLEVEERRKPQKGHFTTILSDGNRVDWILTTSGSSAGERIVLEKSSDLISRPVDGIGLNENQFETIATLRDISKGLILISGPAKSGVTSTFYTLLLNNDPFLNNINTLEKNPSGELQNITQFTYSLSDTGTTTYARRLQSILRKGPDIIGVADCDDAQTAQLTAAAVKDDRIVYVGMCALSVAETLDQWIKYIKDKSLVADTLEAIINQRLIRKLCPDCRTPYQPNPALFKKFNIPPEEASSFYRPGEIEYDKHGKPIVCEKCQGTGFYGRVGLFETIRITDELRDVIRQAKSTKEITSAFRRSGMLYIQEQAIKKVSAGVTSINEVIRIFSKKS